MGKSFLQKLHPQNGIEYFANLNRTFGSKFFWMMVSGFMGSKGAAFYFLTYYQFPYYREAGLEGQTVQHMFSIAYTPWTAKGVIGMLSDLIPLFGYQKKYWCLFYAIFGIPSCLALPLIPLDFIYNYEWVAGILFLFMYLQTAGLDALLEGKFTEQMKKKPESKADLATFSWFCTHFGAMIPSITVGPVSNYSDARLLLFIHFPFFLQSVFPLLLGGIIEDKVDPKKSNKIDFDKFREQFKLIVLTTVHVIFQVTILLINLLASSTVNSISTLTLALIFIAFSFFMIPGVTARANAFNYLIEALYVNVQGGLEYYYSAGPDCVENGPQLSYMDLRTWGLIVATLAQIFGLSVFQAIISKWNFRYMVLSTYIFKVLVAIFDIIIVYRWNTVIGIPDRVAYLIGWAFFWNLGMFWGYMSSFILIAKLCPKRYESTMFALLIGFLNFGTNTSAMFGVLLLDAFKVQTSINLEDGTGCDWTNLALVTWIAHFVLPLIPIALSWFLIPSAYVTDPLLPEEKAELEKPKQISIETQS